MPIEPHGPSAPWAVPVPVRAAPFLPLHPEHAVHAVQTDLGRIGAFGLDPGPPDERIAWADLQLLPVANIERRLGAGRAAAHRGAWLKGIGRTQLAANWNDPEDRYHNSGHLLPSGAVREVLVTRLLEGAGLADTVVGCDGLLVRALHHPADRFLAAMLPEAQGDFATIDRRFQAISVKRADFARWSNLAWDLSFVGQSSAEIVATLARLHALCLPPEARSRTLAASPAAVADAIATGIERALDHFDAWRAIGLSWGSLSNNLTADGRFLDLELPTVLGRPFLGLLRGPGWPEGRGVWPALEVFRFVRRARATLRWFDHRLRHLATDGPGAAEVRRFVGDVADALRARVGPDHPTWDDEALIERVAAHLGRALDLDRAAVDPWVRAGHAEHLARAPAPVVPDGVPVGPVLPRPEPGVRLEARVPPALRDPHAHGWERARAWGDALAAAEASDTAGALLSRLADEGAALAAPGARVA